MREVMSTVGEEGTAGVDVKLEAAAGAEVMGDEGAGAIGPTATMGAGAMGESTTGEAGGDAGAMAAGGLNAKYK